MDSLDKKTYNFDDFKETTVGAISVLLFIFIVKTISGPIMDYRIGFIITILWLYLMYYGIVKMGYDEDYAIIHTCIDFIVCTGVAGAFAVIFGQATLASLIGLQIFGDIIIVLSWSALPVAISFDIHNCNSIIRTKYISER